MVSRRKTVNAFFKLPMTKLLAILLEKAKERRGLIIVNLFFGIFLLYFAWLIWPENTKHGWNDFWIEWGGILQTYGILFALVSSLLSFDFSSAKQALLLGRHKERIRLLDIFAPEENRRFSLKDNQSIYNTVIDLLDRAKDTSSDSEVYLKILVCTPALDYPERLSGNGAPSTKYSMWGSDFMTAVTALASQKNVYTDFAFLSDDFVAGFNPLRGFVETLSTYCASRERVGITPEEIFRDLYKSSRAFIGRLHGLARDPQYNGHINLRQIDNTPFQIFLRISKDLNEVVVSFAGKEILEDHNPAQPRGFHSIDRNVVRAFNEIYDTYLSDHRRTPLAPLQTSKVINCQNQIGRHKIIDYLGVVASVSVDDGIFSPAFANSSKFTSTVLRNLLNKNMSVLDIGAGTGIQALTAYNHLLELKVKPKDTHIWAIEAVKEAYQNLEKNCKGTEIRHRQWEVLARVDGGNGEELVECHMLEKGQLYHDRKVKGGALGKRSSASGNSFESLQKSDLTKFGPFDIVVADLPFVDTQPSSAFERAFYDPNHFNHRILFRTIASCNWLSKGGILLTAFSTLGGLEDLARFERMISEEGLQRYRQFGFYEDGYQWFVYVLAKTNDSDPILGTFWWDKLRANTIEVNGTIQKSSQFLHDYSLHEEEAFKP